MPNVQKNLGDMFVESQFLTSVPAFFQILDGSTMDVCGKSPAPAESCTTRGDQVLLGLESREDGHWLGCISIIELHCT